MTFFFLQCILLCSFINCLIFLDETLRFDEWRMLIMLCNMETLSLVVQRLNEIPSVTPTLTTQLWSAIGAGDNRVRN